jgi:hypothetical protein
MTLSSGLGKLKDEIAALEKAMEKADPQPRVIYIINSPERRHGGPDEFRIGNETYLRREGESRAEFEARTMPLAVAARMTVVCIDAEDFGPGPFLDDFAREIDKGETIEITGGPPLMLPT